MAEAMGDDVRQTWVNNNYAMEGIVHENEGESHVDLWGVRMDQAVRVQPNYRISPRRRRAAMRSFAIDSPSITWKN